MITLFESVKSHTPHLVKLSSVMAKFKSENTVKEVREGKQDKVTLPIVCFAGEFTKRSKDGLVKGSGILILDFDSDDITKLQETYDKLRSDDHLLALFVSTRGNGYKALIKIPEVNSDAEYKKYFKALHKIYPNADESGKDISRACFYSYDPDLYYNPACDTFEVKINEVNYQDYELANRVLNLIRKASVGERHDKILKASRLMGGYVASGKISYQEAERLLEQEAYNADPDDYNTNKRAVIDGLNHGMQEPIHDEAKLEKEELSLKYGKIYYTANDLKNEIEHLFEHGVQRGYDVGFKDLDQYYTVKLGFTTYIYGAPTTGKTQILMEFLINLSVNHEFKHAIFSPETGKHVEIYAELISMVAQKDFYKDYNNQMSHEEMEGARRFVDKHFIVIDPSHNVLTVDEFYDYVEIVERVYNVKIHTTSIDPWNELKHDMKSFIGGRDLYLDVMLGKVRHKADEKNWHNFILTHVMNQEIQVDKATKKRYYPPPTPREIAWGESWYRKGMAMIGLWRPPEGVNDPDGYPYMANQTQVYIQKAKPKGIGKKGEVSLFYEARRHRYKDSYGYAQRISDSEQVQQTYAPF